MRINWKIFRLFVTSCFILCHNCCLAVDKIITDEDGDQYVIKENGFVYKLIDNVPVYRSDITYFDVSNRNADGILLMPDKVDQHKKYYIPIIKDQYGYNINRGNSLPNVRFESEDEGENALKRALEEFKLREESKTRPILRSTGTADVRAPADETENLKFRLDTTPDFKMMSWPNFDNLKINKFNDDADRGKDGNPQVAKLDSNWSVDSKKIVPVTEVDRDNDSSRRLFGNNDDSSTNFGVVPLKYRVRSGVDDKESTKPLMGNGLSTTFGVAPLTADRSSTVLTDVNSSTGLTNGNKPGADISTGISVDAEPSEKSKSGLGINGKYNGAAANEKLPLGILMVGVRKNKSGSGGLGYGSGFRQNSRNNGLALGRNAGLLALINNRGNTARGGRGVTLFSHAGGFGRRGIGLFGRFGHQRNGIRYSHFSAFIGKLRRRLGV